MQDAQELLERIYPLEDTRNLRDIVETQQPLLILETHEYAEWMDWPDTRWIRSYLGRARQSAAWGTWWAS